ncbi:MAG: hypothetical protein R3E12_13185 [Candidatus Eisenbacteria bacterium]
MGGQAPSPAFHPEWIDEELDVVLLLTRSLLEGPPPTEEQQAKLPAFFEAVSRWQRSVRERQLRYLEIALPQRAEFDRGTMSTEESIDVFWRCIDADPHVLHERGEGLRALVVANPELRIWSPAGTNLRVTISPEQTQVHDGIVSEEDIRRGRCAEYLPSGLLSMLPVPGSGEGVIRAPYTFSQGRDFRDITLTVHEGRIVDLDLGSGNESLAEQIQRAAGEPRLISGIDVGINVAGTGSTGKPTLDSRMEGVVTVSFGNNELDGGTVSSTLTLNFPLIKHSLSAGNENLCLDGRLASQG